ncbi:hypothetical protein CsSME_00034146 [Camellia sinensis var. sinensis]
MVGRPNIVPTGHHFLPTEQLYGRWPFLVADGLYPWPMATTSTSDARYVRRTSLPVSFSCLVDSTNRFNYAVLQYFTFQHCE